MSNLRAGGFKTVTKVTAPDGTLHDTKAAAIQHMKDKKVREALEDFQKLTPATSMGVSQVDGSDAFVVFVDDLPQFLFAHRADILAAFNQDVPVRKKREPKVKKIDPKARKGSSANPLNDADAAADLAGLPRPGSTGADFVREHGLGA